MSVTSSTKRRRKDLRGSRAVSVMHSQNLCFLTFLLPPPKPRALFLTSKAINSLRVTDYILLTNLNCYYTTTYNTISWTAIWYHVKITVTTGSQVHAFLKNIIIIILQLEVWRYIGIPVGSWCTILECIGSNWTVEPSWANVPSHPIQGHGCSCPTDAIPSSPADIVWRC